MKRLVMAGISVLAGISLAACGSSGSKAGSGSSAGGAGKSIVIAFPNQLSGGNTAFAQQMVNSANLAANEINAAGGAAGRKLTVKVYDDKATADGAAQVISRAVSVDGASVAMGTYTSIEGLAVRQYTDAREIVFMPTSTISPQMTKGSKFVFRVAVVQTDYPISMAKLANSLNLKRVAVVHDDSPTGSTLYSNITTALKDADIPSPASPVAYALNSTDLSVAVNSTKSMNPDGVIIVGSSAADAGLYVKTLAEQGIKVPIIGFSSLVAPDALKVGGDAYSKMPGIYTFSNKQPSKPAYQDFVKKYAAAYGGQPDQLAATLAEGAGASYDAMNLLAEALKATNGDTGGDALAAAIRGLPPYSGVAGSTGSTISFKDGPTGFSNSLVPFKLTNGVPAEFKQQ
jgi:branched-chain amino acid transport system substrate-binding protein